MTQLIDAGEAVEAYDKLIRKAERRGDAKSPRLMEDAPLGMDELARYFVTLTPGELASCWVGCVTDAALTEYRLNELARALCVVAQRLHGVQWDRPLLIPLPGDGDMTDQPNPTDPQRARPRSGDPLAQPAELEISISDGPPPVPKRGTRGRDKLSAAMDALKPGQWLKVPAASMKKSAMTARVAACKKRMGFKDLRCYTAFNGDIVIIREELKKA